MDDAGGAARRDPVWTADGFVSERWMPVSPVTGRLDAFVWMEPLAQIGAAAGDVIEAGEEPAAIEAAPALAVQPVPPTPEIAAANPAPVPPPSAPISPAPPGPEPAPARTAATAAPAVIPLIHAPDDPGPDGEPHADPVPDVPPPQPNGWDRLRALFK